MIKKKKLLRYRKKIDTIDNAIFLLIKKRKISDKNFFYLTKNNNLNEAGKNLYRTLRMIKKLKYNSISVENIPNKGIGQTINDRLIRASKK